MKRLLTLIVIAAISFVLILAASVFFLSDILPLNTKGAIGMIVGALMYIWSIKMSFERTNQYGVREHSSFGDYAAFGIVSAILKFGGAFLLIIGFFQIIANAIKPS